MGNPEARAAFPGRAPLEKWLLACAAAVVYYALARAGLLLAPGPSHASPAWPAAGFALAAAILWGPCAALGVLIGAFLAHEPPLFAGRGPSLSGALAASGLAALGAAAQALAGAGLLRRGGCAAGPPWRARDAAYFLVMAPLIALIAPSFELLAVAAGGAPPGFDWARDGLTRWLGSAAGLLVVAPLILAWAHARPRPRPRPLRAGPALSPENARLLLLMVESVREYGLFGIDPAGRVNAWSRGAELIYGYGPDEIIGSPYARLLSSEEGSREPLEEAARAGRAKAEGWSVRKDGGRFWAEIALTALRDESGARRGTAAVVRDATQRRASAQVLEKRAADLSRSNLELSQFAYVASHDLSAPLHKVKAFAERLQGRLEGNLDEEGRDYLRRMLRAVDGMQSLIDALLELARVSTRGAAAEEVDLGALARDVVEGLDDAIVRGRAAVELGDLPRINADPLQMRQLLQNLISNGLKFHAPGARAKVRVRGRTTGDGRCELVVSDEGIGFDMKYAERIFQPFQRLQAPYEYAGTGMGLAICRKIAERHGGSITASSSPGRGSEFKVVLPISQEGRMECQPQEKAFS